MDDFLKDLEYQIKDIIRSKKKEKVMNNNNNPLFLFAFVFVLVVGIFVAYKFKTVTIPNQTFQSPFQSNLSPLSQQSQPSDIEVLKRQYEAIYGATTKIWERTKWNSDRMTLLGTLNNHNLVVIQNNYPKSELILLNSDWTINRIPDRISLDPTDKEFLKKFVRN